MVQIKTLCDLDQMLGEFYYDSHNEVVFAGDFNLFFNSNLEASVLNPTLKMKSIEKIIQILEKYNLIDIWRIRNPSSKRFILRKNHFFRKTLQLYFYF